MKRWLSIALLVVAGSAAADELGDANRLLMEKSYAKAFPIYQRLAESGNSEAQMRLGEMYWFGDGTVADLGKARAWFEKSAAAGNADAAASLASLKRRETQGGEITYWTTAYNGADLVSGKYACKAPDLPAASETKRAIKATNDQINAYSECYNGFVENLKSSYPAGKRIPAEVLDMMTPAEAEEAQRHLNQVYAKVAADAKRDAMAFADREAAWRTATEKFVQTDVQRNEERRNDMQWDQQRRREFNTQTYRDAYVK
jgi:hypothetical protein